MAFEWLYIVGGIVLLLFFLSGIRVVKEYEKLVTYYFGRYVGARGPGIFWIVPWISTTLKVDLRDVVMDVPRQEAITADNIPVFVNAIVRLRVVDPGKAVNNVANYQYAISQIAQTTLRAIIGRNALDTLLQERDKVNDEIREIIDKEVDPWGIDVSLTEVKDLDIPDQLKRAMARQAEAERERRARIILAEGEAQSAQKMSQAGEEMSRHPATLMLRFLQTIAEVSAENASTIVLPFPVELMQLANISTKK